MKFSLPVIVIALVQAATASSTVVATVTSSQPFSIRDVQVPVTGVSNWPVFAGDKVSTTSASAVLGSRRKPRGARKEYYRHRCLQSQQCRAPGGQG